VTDADKKAALAELYRRVFSVAYGRDALGDLDARGQRILASSEFLAEHLQDVPVLLVPCQWTRPSADGANQAGYWGSILPAVWSFLLAARSRGLGSVWTTMHLVYEREAAEILDIPYERCAQAGLFPIAYTKGTDFKPAARKSLDTIVHWESWSR
jgi:nitroreductase